MQLTTDTNENKVKKNCRFYNRPVICSALQPECNCYQCVIAERDILASTEKNLRNKIHELEHQVSFWKSKVSQEHISQLEKELTSESASPVCDMNPDYGSHPTRRRRSK